MLIKSIHPKNILSFGPDTEPIELRPLNVLIGPNGSGKSNLLEVISLLQAAPTDLYRPIKNDGGLRDWAWQRPEGPLHAGVSVQIWATKQQEMHLCHDLDLEGTANSCRTAKETIVRRYTTGKRDMLYSFDLWGTGKAEFFGNGTEHRELDAERMRVAGSLLSEIRDPVNYPALSLLDEFYRRIRLFRTWVFGRENSCRYPQRADELNDYLNERCDNLAMVLASFAEKPAVKRRILEMLTQLCPDFTDYSLLTQAATVQLFMAEGDVSIPATRLSDGTLRYLCLLAILCHPSPPPLVCIEEPELGLHPDIIPEVARLLIEASERMQLIVTTHSDHLINALSETPESVLVCEKEKGSTVMRRLCKEDLSNWLDEYRLGEIWRTGQIGGNRW